jgi:catechol 2,3-dioxygenase-like lactoylglutathione lyase family enzyme
MSLQISAILLGVKDLNLTKQFYCKGLGYPIQIDQGGFVSFNLEGGSSTLGLYAWDALASDAGIAADGSGFRGVALNHVVPSSERVDELLAQARRAGGKIVKPAQRAAWGGYFGYFSDPDGHLGKVASSS